MQYYSFVGIINSLYARSENLYQLAHVSGCTLSEFQNINRPWLLLRRSNVSNIGDSVRAGPSNAENNPNTNPNPNIYTATYV